MQKPSSQIISTRLDQLNLEIEQLVTSRLEIATRMTNVMLWGKQAASYSPAQILKVHMENRMKAASVKDMMSIPQMEQIIEPLKLESVIKEYALNAKAALEYLADMVKVQEFSELIKELEELRRPITGILSDALHEESIADAKHYINTGSHPWDV